MKLNIKAKNFNLTDDIVKESEKKFDRLDKYFHKEEEMDLKFAKEGVGFVLESTMFLNGTILRAEAYEETYENAIDRVIDALVRQIRKHKTRLQRSRQTGESIKFEAFDIADEDEYSDEEEIKIAREKTIPVKPMSAEEAILQMELLNHNFFVYQDAEDMEVRVVYKRKKGDYGLIVPTR